MSIGVVGQNLKEDLLNNAIKINQLDDLNPAIYNKLNDFNCIMIGEMHGTNEPANFLIGLTKLLTEGDDSVQVGFEIPDGKMENFLELKTDSSVYQSEFFNDNSNDGRNSIAWLNALVTLNNNPKVNIFFFDVNKSDYNVSNNRDSLMYVKIKRKISEKPHWKTLTISGNIHNMLKPYKDKKTAAHYLINDEDMELSETLCTLNHFYQKGTMLNNIGNGLELRAIDNGASIFSETINSDNYLYLFSEPKSHSGFIFTKIITASTTLTNEN